jgi:hypothetical protein
MEFHLAMAFSSNFRSIQLGALGSTHPAANTRAGFVLRSDDVLRLVPFLFGNLTPTLLGERDIVLLRGER